MTPQTPQTWPASPHGPGTGEETDVVVVGAGLAGLQCARMLHQAGRSVMVVEAADDVGGRIRTDEVDGFLVDRGFQLLNPGYPAVRRWVDTEALSLQPLPAGASLRVADGLRQVAHPLREPRLLGADLRTVATRPGETAALLRWVVPLLGASLRRSPVAATLSRRSDRTLRDSLDAAGLHGDLRRLVDRFYAGVLLEDEGSTSETYALLLARSFAAGVPSLPAGGMGALPHQLAAPLGTGVRLGRHVERVEGHRGRMTVHVAGERLRARHVVVATGAAESERLTSVAAPASKGVVTQWFATASRPAASGMLHVDAREQPTGPLVNCAAVSLAAPSYAPAGQHLVQASALLGPGRPVATELDLRRHAGDLLGVSTEDWETVARHEVPHALPAQPPPFSRRPAVLQRDGVVVCGDHRESSSIQGALVSGARAARLVLRSTVA